MPLPHRRRRRAAPRPTLVLACLAPLATPAAHATAQERPPHDSASRRARVTTSVGLMAGVPGLGAGSGRIAGILDARVARPATRRLSWSLAGTYARANDALGWCPPDGSSSHAGCFTYDHEALVAAGGFEYDVLAPPAAVRAPRLALAGDVGVGAYHERRKGPRPDYPLRPTRWHLMGPVASLGLVGAHPIGTRLEGVVAGRVVVAQPWALMFGMVPRPQPALSVGLRW